MISLCESVKKVVPKSMWDGIRYVADPQYREAVRSARARSRHRMRVDAAVKETAALLWSTTGGKVASGPFKGMHYIGGSVGSQWAPKLLGTYEKELGGVIEETVEHAPPLIVDIGAAEGYYAVGLAWRLPGAEVIAFESDERSHGLLRELARANGVAARVQTRGHCTTASLSEVIGDGAGVLVVCDVEGAELDILDPANVPGLRHAVVLVEVHPWAAESLAEVLRHRFKATHDIREYVAHPRTIEDLPAPFATLPDSVALACMDEARPCPMTWLWMTPLSRTCTR